MDEEIDSVFLEKNTKISDKRQVEDLKKLEEKLPDLIPHIRIVKENTKTLKETYIVHNVLLSSVSKDLDELEKETARFQEENDYDSVLYNHIKSILVGLRLEPSHLDILEHSNFQNKNDLAKLEKVVNILIEFSRTSYEIRIVKEKKSAIDTIIRRFLKKFLLFMKKQFEGLVPEENISVHKELYTIMKKYSFVFAISKNYKDYEMAFLVSYINRAAYHYKCELTFDIERGLDNIKEGKDYAEFINLILSTYNTVISCEKMFWEHMMFGGSYYELFKDTNKIISEFISHGFERFTEETLCTIDSFLTNRKTNLNPELQNDITAIFERLKTEYLEYYRRERDPHRALKGLSKICKDIKSEDLVNMVGDQYKELLKSQLDRKSLWSTIKTIQLSGEAPAAFLKRMDVSEIRNSCFDVLPRLVTKYLFSDSTDDGLENKLEKILRMMEEPHRSASEEIFSVVKVVVDENADEDLSYVFKKYIEEDMNK